MLSKRHSNNIPVPDGGINLEVIMGKEGKKGVRAIERAADILLSLGRSEMTLSEISKESGLNKATVFRMLASLELKGFVSRDHATGRYSLDWGLLGLIAGALHRSQELEKNVYPYLEKLRQLTGETITLYIRKGLNRLCIAELPSTNPLRYTVGIGVTVPLHAGSPGKLLLAYLPLAIRDEIIDQLKMNSLTGKTITSKESLLEELQLIREQGWATSFGERIEGVSSLSVPVTDGSNNVVASLNILGPYIRLGEERLMEFLEPTKEAAREISARLILRSV